MSDADPSAPICSVWLLPATGDATVLTRVVDRLAARRGTPVFVPHLTVRGTLDAGPHELGAVLGQAATRERPVRARVEAVAGENDRFRALYLHLAPFPALERLRRALAAAFGPRDGFPPPHVSLLYQELDVAERRRLRAEIETLGLPRSIYFDRVAVVDHGRDLDHVEGWRIASRLRLGG